MKTCLGDQRDIPCLKILLNQFKSPLIYNIVLLASGAKVPADLRLVEVTELRAEEAALTGESVPVEKTTWLIAEE
ncbi:MAG: hypothetical protein C0392_15665, partial [Syntrophus sp. (in: bacteria)]|nr:hypothetical protein [Syntrophus sp. (in: bacteria)]